MPRSVRDGSPRLVGFPRERRELTPLERLVLFVCGADGARSEALLEGLVEPQRGPALALARKVGAWEPSLRHARLVHELGPSRDARDRLRELIATSPPRLRAAIVEALPEELRLDFPQHVRPHEPASPALRELAGRLVRERL